MSKVNSEEFREAYEYVKCESGYINNLVDEIVKSYSAELDEFILMVRSFLEMVKQGTMETYDDESLQMQIIKLPTLLYFCGDGLEAIGADSDVAEYRRKEIFNQVISSLDTREYTIPDKKAAAERQTEYEAMLKEIYDRAYKKLKLKIDMGIKLLESMKKVADVRIAKINKGKGWDNGGATE